MTFSILIGLNILLLFEFFKKQQTGENILFLSLNVKYLILS